MKYCLLCEEKLASYPTWQEFISLANQKIICEACSKSFERADIVSKVSSSLVIRSLFTYNEAMQSYLQQFKFLQDIALAAVFREELRTILIGKNNIIPIPIHPKKRIERTFGQVEALLDYAKIPYQSLLEKGNEVTMSEKTREERLKVESLFHLRKGVEIQAETYILIDDIYTTGTTIHHAAETLLAAGAQKVEAVTLIRA